MEIRNVVSPIESLIIHTFHISGKMTICDDVDRLTSLVEKAIKEGARLIKIDLSEVAYMDVTGSTQLIVIYNTCRQAGVGIIFVNPSPRVAKTFETTKLDTIFEIVNTEKTVQ